MTARRLYPYTFSDGLELRVDAVTPEIPMDEPTRYLRLWEEDAESWQVLATIRLPSSVLDAVLPPVERAAPPVALRLRLRSTSSRLRRTYDLALPEVATDAVELALDIDAATWSGFIDVEALLVRTEDSASGAGRWAVTRGTILAAATPIRIDVDTPVTPPGDSLTVQWEDFETSEKALLKRARGTLFALESSQTRDHPPTLLLNSSIDGIRTVLESKGKHGWAARSRDAVFQTIVHQGWSSLIGSALGELKDQAALRPDEGEEVLEEVLAALSEWMQTVLRTWAPLLWPEEPTERAVERTWEAVRVGDWEELMHERLPVAIAKRFDTAKGLRGLVTEYGQ
jgi:hypothetical protein